MLGASGDIFPEPVHTQLVKACVAIEEAYDLTYYASATEDNLKSPERGNGQGKDLPDPMDLGETEEEDRGQVPWAQEERGKLSAAWVYVADCLREVFTYKDEEGVAGCHISFDKPKMHAFKHLPLWVKLFGSPQFYNSTGMELFHKYLKDAAVNDNGRGCVGERIIDDAARAEYCELVCRLFHSGDPGEDEMDEDYVEVIDPSTDCKLNPMLRKCRLSLAEITDKKLSQFVKMGAPCTNSNIEHCLALFYKLLCGRIADDREPGWMDAAPDGTDTDQRFDWSINLDNIPASAKPEASEVYIHTSVKRVVPADRSPTGRAFAFRVRATPTWQYKKSSLFDFVTLDMADSDEPVHAQVLLLFTCKLPSVAGHTREERKGAFVRYLHRWSPEDDEKEDREILRQTNKDLIPEREAVLKFKGNYGFDVVPLEAIGKKLYVTPDFNWAKFNKKARNQVYSEETLPKWMQWGWLHNHRPQVVVRDISHRHHFDTV